MSLDGRNGDFNGMSHSGVAVTVRNAGRDCVLPALPEVQFRDARGRVLQAVRKAPVGMHPGPVMVPVHLRAGQRVVTELRWVSGAVFDQSRSVRAARLAMRVAGRTISAPIAATLYGAAGQPVGFDQSPLH